MMKYVEFLGIPGSGKTTVLHKTLAMLQAENITAVSKYDARKIAMHRVLQRESGFFVATREDRCVVLGISAAESALGKDPVYLHHSLYASLSSV